MAAIIANHYRENYEALSREPVVISMARDTLTKNIPFKLVHDSGCPTFEFMQASRTAYWRAVEAGKATVESGSIGAVAEAILIVRERLAEEMT